MERISYMGQQVWPKQKRDKRGKYPRYNWLMRKVQSVKEWMMWFSIRVGIAGAIAAFGFGMYLMGQFDNHRAVYASNVFELRTPRQIPDVMKRIADCESGLRKGGRAVEGSARQFDEKGNLVTNTNGNGTTDAGRYQINVTADTLKESLRLGYDIMTEEGNVGYAMYLFDNRGTQPWNSSRSCWSR